MKRTKEKYSVAKVIPFLYSFNSDNRLARVNRSTRTTVKEEKPKILVKLKKD